MKKWSKEVCYIEAKKYNSKGEFKNKCCGAYRAAIKNGWMPKYTWFIKYKQDNTVCIQKYIDNARKKYNGFYDYSQINLEDIRDVSHTKVPIICPKHGIFWQNLWSHVNCSCPCPLCRKGVYAKSNKNKIQTLIQDRIEHGVIYCYTDKLNGKKYVGQSISEERRKKDHLREKQKHKALFDKVLQKKDIENFEYEILFETNEKRSEIFNILNEKEKYYIKLFNSQVPNGYNISEGGRSVNWMIGYKPTEETLQKLRDSHKGKQSSMKGKHYSKEQRKIIRGKRDKTIKEKYVNGKIIPQRENIIMFEIINAKDANLVGIFPNAKEIERQFGINFKRIHYVMRKKCPLDSKYIFVYEKEYNDNKEILDLILSKKSAKLAEHKKVEQLDLNGNLIATYLLSDATNMFGRHVSDCCNGKRYTTKGFKFRWID